LPPQISSISETSPTEACVAAHPASGGSSILRKSKSSLTIFFRRFSALAKGFTKDSAEISRTIVPVIADQWGDCLNDFLVFIHFLPVGEFVT